MNRYQLSYVSSPDRFERVVEALRRAGHAVETPWEYIYRLDSDADLAAVREAARGVDWVMKVQGFDEAQEEYRGHAA